MDAFRGKQTRCVAALETIKANRLRIKVAKFKEKELVRLKEEAKGEQNVPCQWLLGAGSPTLPTIHDGGERNAHRHGLGTETVLRAGSGGGGIGLAQSLPPNSIVAPAKRNVPLRRSGPHQRLLLASQSSENGDARDAAKAVEEAHHLSNNPRPNPTRVPQEDFGAHQGSSPNVNVPLLMRSIPPQILVSISQPSVYANEQARAVEEQQYQYEHNANHHHIQNYHHQPQQQQQHVYQQNYQQNHHQHLQVEQCQMLLYHQNQHQQNYQKQQQKLEEDQQQQFQIWRYPCEEQPTGHMMATAIYAADKQVPRASEENATSVHHAPAVTSANIPIQMPSARELMCREMDDVHRSLSLGNSAISASAGHGHGHGGGFGAAQGWPPNFYSVPHHSIAARPTVLQAWLNSRQSFVAQELYQHPPPHQPPHHNQKRNRH